MSDHTNPSPLTDPGHLRREAYRTPARLNARITLHEGYSTNPQPWFEWVFEQLELAVGCRVLEVGCGPGGLWEANRERLPAGAAVSLSDLSLGMLTEAAHRLGAPPFSYAAADAQALPFPNGRFDAILANHMLFHVPDRERAYQSFARLLHPGGTLYAATNGLDHMLELADLINAFDPDIKYHRAIFGFNLENGEHELGKWFDEVELREYPDALQVTKAAPLAAFVASLSFHGSTPLSEDRLDDFTAYLQAIIDHQGVIPIQKSTGLFIARHPII